MLQKIKKFYNPTVFQGSLKNKKYFEGWYFKVADFSGEHVLALIPGISLGEDSHAFVQVIYGSKAITAYYRFPLTSFETNQIPFEVKIQDNIFRLDGMDIHLVGGEVEVSGSLTFLESLPWKGKWHSPGIMGWYSFMPFMECYHGVVSLMHRLSGKLNVSGVEISLDKGFGYIEKDWGTAFPECWVWMQGNHFKNEEASVMFSVAKIPWLGKYFLGHICFIVYKRKIILFATYNGSKIKKLDVQDRTIQIVLESREYRLELIADRTDGGDLKAPTNGDMTRIIKESVGAEIKVTLRDKKNNIIFQDRTISAGLEITGNILKYLEN